MTQTCKDGQWTVDSTAIMNMMKCDEEGATQNMMGMATMVCKNGQWEYDSTATAAANTCTEEGATKTETMSMMGTDIEMTYVCKDGQWTMDMSSFGGMFGGEGGGMGGDVDWSQYGGGDFGGGNFGGAGQIPEETPGLK